MKKLKTSRQSIIIQRLEQDKFVSTTALANEFKVSVETIRRDLEQMERIGVARKVYGGAELSDSHAPNWPSFATRSMSFPEAKAAIGRRAADFIPDSSTLALDVGSTITQLCRMLPQKKDLIIICNDVQSANQLINTTDHKIYMMGGFLSPDGVSSGPYIREFFQSISDIDIFVCSTDGLSPEEGLTTNRERTYEMERRYIKKAKRTILLADHSKFSQRGFYKMCDIRDIDLIITDSETPSAIVDQIRESGTEVEVVELY